MRQIINLNRKWAFSKEATAVPTEISNRWNFVNLPHSWNAIDGQDGNADYFRGTAYYAKSIDQLDLPKADRYYLEINGANSSAKVYWNGKQMAEHHGGYSTWRVDVTDVMTGTNLVVIEVDNAPNQQVYPQNADFTFYGGLYRDVNLICVAESHFDLEYHGGPGIAVTPIIDGDNANVTVDVYVKNLKEGQYFQYTVVNAEGNAVANAVSTETSFTCTIENVHKWHGRRDPYLYTAEVNLVEGKEILDNVSARFGCRSYEIDPDRGFILNGEEYPLRGVSRHQDRWGFGNALLPEHHKEDMELICEVGATTIRLAHYQHSQYFYDLCDEYGQVIWAEIPYITTHMVGGRENTISQMKELIIQNYNHPSIVVWGLSNEIDAGGTAHDADLVDNHKVLNALCHELDKTRLTTMACVSGCDPHHAYVFIPNTVSYNHYFGWYGGELEDYGPWFDKFHAEHPKTPIGVSEYGCEALNWHNSHPENGDYSEEYQALYHESLIRQLFSRKYLWATHVWNMFDFGADGRNEGGEDGQNHKGLVTFDRKYKKDSFYAYKAWLSDEPFVHLCGKRYIDRVEDVTKVTVYSNQPSVELFANGESLGVKEAADHFFYFDVPNVGETNLKAVAGHCTDESTIRKVDTFNEDYLLKEKGAVLNWFDITEKEGYLSLNSKLSEIMATAAGKIWFSALLLGLKKKMDAAGKENEKGEKKGFSISLKSVSGMMDMMGSFTVLRLSSMVGMVGVSFTKEELLAMNAQLNKIKAPRK